MKPRYYPRAVVRSSAVCTVGGLDETGGVDDQLHIIKCGGRPPFTLVEGVEAQRHRPPHGWSL